MPYTGLLHPEPLPLQQTDHCWSVPSQETLRHSSGSVSVGSLGPGAQGLFQPSEHLWRVRSLILNAILPLLPSFWGFSFALGHGVSFLVGSNILQLTIVEQQVVVLAFSQEKMSTCPSTLPSSRDVSQLLTMAELVLDGVWGLQKPLL